MSKQDDVDSIVQNFAANELSSLDKIGSDNQSLQLSPKYTRPETSGPNGVQGGPQTSSGVSLNNPKRESTSSFKSNRKSTTPSETSQEVKQTFGDKLKSFRRITSGKK